MALKNAMEMKGARVLITGAAGGIGAATARACAALGADLALCDMAPLDALAAELEGEGVKLSTHRLDVADRAAVETLAGQVGRVDAAAAVAGICPFDDWIESDDFDAVFRQVMDVNVLGSLNVARAWLPRMAQQGGGRIVLVGSIAGRNGGVSPIVQPSYVASKGGVHALVRWLAQRAAPQGVLVNGVAPGPVGTEMTATTPYGMERWPLKRLGRPEEIAWPIAFLCSPAASYFTGAILDANGGTWIG